MVPYATQTKLTKLLRKYGFPVKRNQVRRFAKSSSGPSYFMDWVDEDQRFHHCHYFGCAGRPVLLVDQVRISITLDDVKEFGLFKFTLSDQPPTGG